MTQLMNYLPKEHIQVKDKISTWQEAVKITSQPLLEEKKITPVYVENMIDSVYQNGPYMVLADYFALMHAKPGIGVCKQSMSLLVTKNEVDLAGKPIKRFLVLAATDSASHLESLQEIMEVFMDEEKYQLILKGNLTDVIQVFQ